MAVATAIAAGVAVAGAVKGGVDSAKAKKRAAALAAQADEMAGSRQAAINPYANITNPFANLTVNTKGAEFKAEQADVSLANSLDAMRQSGGGSGMATQLAKLSLESKMNIANDIDKQEEENNKLRAQGAADVQMKKAQGEEFKFGIQESRQTADLNRVTGLAENEMQAAAAGKAAMWSGLGSAVGTLASAGLAKKGGGWGGKDDDYNYVD
jgi:hypothetical protein